MDIAINNKIEYDELRNFLARQFPALDFYLIYEGLNDWDEVKGQKPIFQYLEYEEVEQGFRYGISVYIQCDDELSVIERLSSELSNHFKCSAFCDASRIVLKERNPYYSLLFENGKVYLVDDFIYEETGQVTKIVELAYECPEYDFVDAWSGFIS